MLILVRSEVQCSSRCVPSFKGGRAGVFEGAAPTLNGVDVHAKLSGDRCLASFAGLWQTCGFEEAFFHLLPRAVEGSPSHEWSVSTPA